MVLDTFCKNERLSLFMLSKTAFTVLFMRLCSLHKRGRRYMKFFCNFPRSCVFMTVLFYNSLFKSIIICPSRFSSYDKMLRAIFALISLPSTWEHSIFLDMVAMTV